MQDIGFHLGKWIYVIDAIDDLPRDIKKNEYNPLKNENANELSDMDKQALYSGALLELNQMSKSVELLDFTKHRDIEAIIKNIIYDGLVCQTRRVLKFTLN